VLEAGGHAESFAGQEEKERDQDAERGTRDVPGPGLGEEDAHENLSI
jgi:hypothetical protein